MPDGDWSGFKMLGRYVLTIALFAGVCLASGLLAHAAWRLFLSGWHA